MPRAMAAEPRPQPGQITAGRGIGVAGELSGVVLERTLFVQAHTPVEVARCADILLRSKAFAVVVVPAVRLRATVWSRLCGLAQKSGALLLVLGMFAGTELA